MSDRYQQLVNTPIGRIVTRQVGLPNPVALERYRYGQAVITGTSAEETFKALVFDASPIASSETQRGSSRRG
jgi:hypothetical protein